MINRNQIPPSWEVVKLGDVCENVEVVKRKEKSKDKEFLYLDIGGIDNSINKIVSHKEYKWKDAPSRAQQIIFKDDVLFSTVRTYLKNIAIVENKTYNGEIASSGFTVIRGNKEVTNPKFLFYVSLSHSFLQPLNELQTGSSYPAVRDKDVFSQPIPLPPLPQQHRIVFKIEELFSELDKGIESLKTAQQQLKVYRQAVLKWAFEGRLTEEWRIKNGKLKIKNADELLKEIKSAREKKAKEQGKKLKPISSLTDEELGDLYELPEGWRWIKIVETVFNTADDIVDGPFGSNLKNSDYVDGSPIPVISISNIEEGFDKKIRYITKEKFETIKRSAVYPGDVIVAKIGSTYGKTGIYPDWMPVGVIPANLLRVRPSNHFSKKLLVHYLKSRGFKNKLDGIMKSTAQPAYNVSMFKELPIPFMSLEEQHQIVQEIETRLSVCDKLEETITHSLQQSEVLRQSILKKAFEGKLVEQDPKDEPAAKLLERRKAESTKNEVEKKKSRRDVIIIG